VWFTVLGPVRAWAGETELELGPPRQRALLALLLAGAGRPVALGEIVDVLWGQDPPGSALNVVHRYVGALRRLLEPGLPTRAAGRWLVRASGGYRLDVDAGTLDLLRFRQAAELARRTAESSPGEAVEGYAGALALWQGPAASGIPAELRSHPVFGALDRELLAAVRQAADTALRAGLPERVLEPLQRAADLHPLDEALQARLVLCLAAGGHQAEALEVHRAVRTRLAEELGIEPGPELRDAHRQILHRTAPQAPARAPAPPPAADTATIRPAQLPPDLPTFTGRTAELALASNALPEEGGHPTAVVISAIGGMAGIGKTTLAVHWAHRIAHRFPDGQLYVNLRGFDPTGTAMPPGEAVRLFLDALGVPAQRVPAGLDAQVGLYRSLLAERRVLVVLDNARDTEQVRPLLPGNPECLVIVTSRNQLSGLVAIDGARPLTMDLLPADEARAFLAHRIGAQRLAAEPAAVEEIVDRCAGLPLALAIVAARAVTRPGFTLCTVAAELRESHGSLDAFTGDDAASDARAVFSWSYRALTADAARLFRLLALHPGPDITVHAAAGLAGLPVPRTRALLNELTRAHLAGEHRPGRWSCHDLLRSYASELVRTVDGDAERRTAVHRMLDHYLHTAAAAMLRFSPHREQIPLPPPLPDASPGDPADQRRAVAWFRAEQRVLPGVVEVAAATGFGGHAWRLAWALDLFLDRHGRWHDQVTVQGTALAAAQRAGDDPGQAHAHRALGFAHARLGRQGAAQAHLRRALDLFTDLGDPIGQGLAHRSLAFAANGVGLHRRALYHYDHALELFRITGHRNGQARVFNEVGWTHILLGEYEQAVARCEQAIALHGETGDPNGVAAAADSLGYAHHHLGHHAEALACYRRALGLYRRISDHHLAADTLVHIGDTHAAAGDRDAARTAWRQALAVLEELDHPDAGPVRARLRQPGEPAHAATAAGGTAAADSTAFG
jgi:DNA-binding SARP family transcriptional activator/tetratricopeptide (TPR) repeat protein